MVVNIIYKEHESILLTIFFNQMFKGNVFDTLTTIMIIIVMSQLLMRGHDRVS